METLFGRSWPQIKGDKNVVVDTLSRLERWEGISPIVGKNDAPCSDIKDDSLDSFYPVFDGSKITKVFTDGMKTEDNLSELIKEHNAFLI